MEEILPSGWITVKQKVRYLTSYEKKSVIAIGVGFMVPWEIPISSSSLNKFLENKNNKIKTM